VKIYIEVSTAMMMEEEEEEEEEVILSFSIFLH
jgi:hypothetical protein